MHRKKGGRSRLVLRFLSGSSRRGELHCGWIRGACALGRCGIRSRKREGDGATPAGVWRLREVWWRADRCRRPATRLPVRRISRDDGWCDTPADRNYNRHIHHPYPAGAERLWRDDDLYNIVVVLDHNVRPRIRGRGSAVFVHLARPDLGSTEGCIALGEKDLRNVLARTPIGTRLFVGR